MCSPTSLTPDPIPPLTLTSPALHLPPRHPPPPLRCLPNLVTHRIPPPFLHHKLPHSQPTNSPPIRLLPRSLHPHHIIPTPNYPLAGWIMETRWSSQRWRQQSGKSTQWQPKHQYYRSYHSTPQKTHPKCRIHSPFRLLLHVPLPHPHGRLEI